MRDLLTLALSWVCRHPILWDWQKNVTCIGHQIGMGGILSMPAPQYPPILYQGGLPFTQWFKLASSVKEINELCRLFEGIPESWIEWVECHLTRASKLGIMLDKPLNYRRSLLWNGIISLQEGKFICDVVENAIRHKLLECLTASQTNIAQLSRSIPGYDDILFDFGKKRSNIVMASNKDIMLNFTLYQLTEMIVRNWKFMGKLTPRITGFNQIFWSHKHCRDVNRFQSDTKIIRNYRNTISHSRNLLAKHELRELYDVSQVWLKAIQVDLDEKISIYRKKRPLFLTGISR
jgi:hypothetical protein